MTEPTSDLPEDVRDDPPPTAAELLDERPPPATEAERQTRATVRSVSRLEESD
jgi:hypothetical protein